jgi:probable dihydroxyacetone kinase regulator
MSEMTKVAMVEALKKLLITKPITKITVSDITDACQVNRMTFYYHFKDIYDLLEWGIINEGQKILAGNKTAKTWQQGMKNIFETALENKAFVTNAYHSLGRERTEKYLDEPVFDLTYGVVNEESKGMSVSEENKVFIAQFYKYALIGLVLDWVRNNMNEDYHLILAKMDTVLSGETKNALLKFRTDKA